MKRRYVIQNLIVTLSEEFRSDTFNAQYVQGTTVNHIMM